MSWWIAPYVRSTLIAKRGQSPRIHDHLFCMMHGPLSGTWSLEHVRPTRDTVVLSHWTWLRTLELLFFSFRFQGGFVFVYLNLRFFFPNEDWCKALQKLAGGESVCAPSGYCLHYGCCKENARFKFPILFSLFMCKCIRHFLNRPRQYLDLYVCSHVAATSFLRTHIRESFRAHNKRSHHTAPALTRQVFSRDQVGEGEFGIKRGQMSGVADSIHAAALRPRPTGVSYAERGLLFRAQVWTMWHIPPYNVEVVRNPCSGPYMKGATRGGGLIRIGGECARLWKWNNFVSLNL